MLIHILPVIFGHLSMKDWLRCRQVCRAWRYVVYRDFLEELCLYLRSSYAPDLWAIHCKPIDRRTVLTIDHLGVLSNPNFLNTFRNLKRLMIRIRLTASFKLNNDPRRNELAHLRNLNALHQLEHLELYEVPFGFDENFALELSGLKKYFYHNSYGYWSDNLLPPNLETLGFADDLFVSKVVSIKVFGRLQDRLKVLIVMNYSPCFLLLTNLEQLHLLCLKKEDKKPTAFLARFPKLLLLNIFCVGSELHLNQLLHEVNSLKPTRSVQFHHQGFEISSEKFKNCKRSPFAQYSPFNQRDLNGLLSIGSENAGLVRPFVYFENHFFYQKINENPLSKPLPFEILKNFRNIRQINIQEVSYEEMRSLLVNIRQLLALTIRCDSFNEKFFRDLPGILENLVLLKIYLTNREQTLKSLDFLNAFKQLLAFEGRFEENEKNQQIIERIEERRKSLPYPVLAGPYELRTDGGLSCKNSRF